MASYLINKEAFHLIDHDEGCVITTKDSHSDHGTITTKGLDEGMGSLGENPTNEDLPSNVWWQCDLTGSGVKMAPISSCDWSMVEGEITKAKSQDMTSEIGAHWNGSIDFPDHLRVGKMGEGGDKMSDAEEKLTKFLYEERYGQERPSFYCDSHGVLRMPKMDAIKKEIKEKDLGQSSELTNFFLYEERYGQERPSFYRDSHGVLEMPKLDAIKKDLVQTRRQRSMRRMLWAPSSLDEEYLLSTATLKAGYSFKL